MSKSEFLRGDDPATAPESAQARQRRLTREAEDLARADASVAAGRVVDAARVKAWIDSIGTDHERPVPYSGSGSRKVS